jgi:hypothetical protein
MPINLFTGGDALSALGHQFLERRQRAYFHRSFSIRLLGRAVSDLTPPLLLVRKPLFVKPDNGTFRRVGKDPINAQLRGFFNNIIHGTRFQKGLAESDLYGGGCGLRKGLFKGDQDLPASSGFYDCLKTGPFAIHKDESVSAAHS